MKIKKLFLFVIISFVLFNVNAQQGNEVVVLDREIADVQVIIDGLKPGVKWFYLDQSIDALSSISSILKDNYPVKALHLYTHGIPGTILLSYDEISAERLEQRSSDLRLWENYFLDGGDILLYGCEIGKGKSGEDFCNKLKQYTGLDVAASVNNTGSEAKGGDWILELNVGNIETTNSITFQAQNLYNNILGDVLVVDFDGGSTFNGSIISQFYNNLEGHTGTLSSSSILNLSNYELVYVIQPTRVLTDAEIDNLLALLDRGGRIVFMGEHGGYTPSQNSNISDALIRLGAHFSIVNESTDGNWTACNRDMKGEGIMADVAIFEGVNTIDYNYMAPISMGGAAQVLITHRSEPSKTYMAMEKIRNGSIIMFADQNIWDHVAETSCNDNAIFFENLIDLSCEDIANQQRALLTTIEAYSISGSDADCGGNIIDDKGSEIIQRGVCWSSITMSPTITDSKVTDTGAGDGLFAVKLSGLLLNTTYYARAFAVNGNGIAYGNMISFTTPAVQNTSPTAVSDSYSCEVNTSILGNVTNNDFDDDGDPVTVNMVTAPSYHSGIFTLGADGTFNYAHDGTSAPSDYFSYYLFDGVSKSATVGVGITLVVPQNAPVGSNESISFDSGEIYGFTTSDFTFTDADGHSFNGVKLLTVPDKGILRYNGLPVSAGGICNDVSKLTFDQNGDGTFVTPYTSFSFKVIDSSGQESDVSYIFTINVIRSNVVPGITTQAVNNITSTTAVFNGTIADLGYPTLSQHGFCWSTEIAPTIEDVNDFKVEEGATSSTGSFTSSITSLEPNTTYYVKAFATNSEGTSYGEQVSFTTVSFNPPVFTAPSAAFDISNAEYTGKSINAVSGFSTKGVTFSKGGMKMYLSGLFDGKVVEYDLSTPYDILTANFVQEKVLSGVVERFLDIQLNSDGSKLFMAKQYGTVQEYILSTPYDISTMSLNYTLNVVSDDYGIYFSNDGLILYVVGEDTKKISQYNLSTAFDLSTASNSGNSFTLGSEASNCMDVTFSTNGDKMLVMSPWNGIWEYNLSIPFNISTAVFAGSDKGFDPGTQEADAYGMAFNTNGDKFYIVGADKKVYQYEITASVDFAENGTGTVTDADANDGDGGADNSGITYSLTSGGDNDLFNINQTSGVITFKSAPDWENPGDSDTDNVYEITVIANDGSASNNISNQDVSITVTDVEENYLASVTTQAVSSISTTTATANGTISDLGFPNPTAHGVCWNTTGTPTILNGVVNNGAASATGAFTASMSSLSAGTLYYVRAYATNSTGTAYGEQVSFTTAKNSQTITFSALASKTYGDIPFNLSGSASSGLTVSYTSSDPSVATVSGNTVTIVGVGSTTITASQGGDASYNAAPNVVQTLTVDKKAVSISNFNDMTKLYFDGSFEIDAPTSNSAGAFTYTSSNTAVATVSGTTVTILSEGSTEITATQAPHSFYAGGSITATLTVNSVDVVTKQGENTRTNAAYVNKNGAVGGNTSVNKNGKQESTKSEVP